MLRTDDLYKEISILEEKIKENKVTEADKLKAQILNLKLLHNLRSNSVLLMRKMGIEMIKAKTEKDEEAKSESKGK